MDDADLLGRAQRRLLSRANAMLAVALERLHHEAMAAGPDVNAHLQTLYLTYAAGRVEFASILPRPEGYLDLGLPHDTVDARLRKPSKVVWRQQLHSVHVRSTNEVDEHLVGLIEAAYVHISPGEPAG